MMLNLSKSKKEVGTPHTLFIRDSRVMYTVPNGYIQHVQTLLSPGVDDTLITSTVKLVATTEEAHKRLETQLHLERYEAIEGDCYVRTRLSTLNTQDLLEDS